MTEAEWLAATDPTPMLEFLREKGSDRKLRLFAVACCRKVNHYLVEDCSYEAIDVLERYADGQASGEELIDAADRNDEALGPPEPSGAAVWAVACAIAVPQDGPEAVCAVSNAIHSSRGAACSLAGVGPDQSPLSTEQLAEISSARTAQIALLRDIFGNPFRPVAVDPVWRTSTAIALAKQMYESRDFSAMPILADALEEAGCENEDILNHCRSDSPHVRGCWVVDLILGKE